MVLKSPDLNKVAIDLMGMKKNYLFSGLMSALCFVVCIMTQDIDIRTDVYAQNSSGMLSNSTNATGLMTKNDKVGLQIEDLSVTKSPTGIADIIGKIRNNSTTNVNDLNVTAEFFDKDGASIDKSDRFVTSQSFVLKPGEVVPFKLLPIVSFDRIGNYTITANGDVTN
ncbi:MAG TPA: FxLYD domain-containing protein [Nitrososphaeraceae archaeon]|jgi:hypothetical protein